MRLTRKVFTDLGIYMIGFGLLMGMIFPPFMLLLGIPSTYVISVPFFACCVAAGIMVGSINMLLARIVVGGRIRELSEKMKFIGDKLKGSKAFSELEDCASEDCVIPEDSDDELGDGARSFNSLVTALSQSITSESVVRSFNIMLSSQLELETLTKSALDYILNRLDADAGAIIIERGGAFELAHSIGIKDPAKLLDSSHLWNIVEHHRPLRKIFREGITIDGILVDFAPADVAVYPILYKDISLGLIVLASGSVFSDRSIQTLEILIQSMALALKNAVTYDQLQKLAANDPLTGLYNRRFGMIRLSEEFTRSVRTGLPIGLLFFDIDHFKKVNDTYGHTLGDRVLVNLAKITSMAARKGDLVVRYGGDEFVVILPGAANKDCLFIAERLRHMVEESTIQFGDISVRVTVSIGVSSYPEYNVENEHELLKAADKALYLAKDKGRNMVVAT